MPLGSPSRHRSLLKPMGMSRELTAAADTQVVQMEFDCRPSELAASLSLRESKYQETAAGCHPGTSKQMGNTMAMDLASVTATEAAAIKAYDALTAAKREAVDAPTASITAAEATEATAEAIWY